jgi:hypothetical protein
MVPPWTVQLQLVQLPPAPLQMVPPPSAWLEGP